ncbi:hypothetical protein ACH47Z_42625 [Streptomyces sp. NPDC020192]|uniref:hypothetical protein n=1 Tax=Streptomyces sp. NPDC020192 TaxID=3365066 RepID=UPI00379FE3A2
MHTIDELRLQYGELMDHQADSAGLADGPAVATLVLDPADPPTRTALRVRLTDLFVQQPDLAAVILTAGEDPLGVVRRDALQPDAPDAHRTSGAPGAQPMPGLPTRARAQYYVCTHCQESEILLFGDGLPPQCPHGHGPMAEEE